MCHLCVALIGLLVSYFVVATRNPKTTGCFVTALLLHYFLLATFSWMGVEGINMYLAFVKVMSAHVPRFIPKAVVIAWGKCNLKCVKFKTNDSFSSDQIVFNGPRYSVSWFKSVIEYRG